MRCSRINTMVLSGVALITLSLGLALWRASGEAVELKAYDFGEHLEVISDFPAPMFEAAALPADSAESARVRSKDQLLARLRRFIPSSKNGGGSSTGLEFAERTLLAEQAPATHALIDSYLRALSHLRETLIHVETRVLTLRGRVLLPAHRDMFCFTKEQASEWIAALARDGSCRLEVGPRLTTFTGQRAHVMVTRSSPLSPDGRDPVALAVDVRAHAVPLHDSVRMDLCVRSNRDLEHATARSRDTEIRFAGKGLTCRDGHVLVLRLGSRSGTGNESISNDDDRIPEEVYIAIQPRTIKFKQDSKL